jgi:hypothetical protein
LIVAPSLAIAGMTELVAVILQLLGGGKQGRIDRGGANGGPNLAHRFAHGVKESVACVLHQMPAVGHLHRIGEPPPRRQRIAAALIAGRDGDLRLAGQPSLGGRRFSIWQQRDRLPAFEITDQRSIAMAAAPGPIIVANDRRGAKLGLPRLRTARNRVSLLTDMLQRSEKLAADRPPRASAKQWTI